MKISFRGLREVLGSLVIASALIPACMVLGAAHKTDPPEKQKGPSVLWRDPADIATRDLYYGPGGSAHEPRGGFKFVTEDMDGSSPKFEIVAEDGTRWKAKLGVEARPETVASRLLWAAGYFANEDYFVPALRVEGMPRLHRGQKDVGRDGVVHDVRLKRHLKNESKIGIWSWANSPFSETREWYGLRVLMAIMNNWDLKDVNNSVYQVEAPEPEAHYLVSDLGASFGTTGLNRGAKGSVEAYQHSKWFRGSSGGFVDFNVPSTPGGGFVLVPSEMVRRLGLLWIGHHIPVEDARWMGSILARLSPAQIRDAFRAGGYPPAEVEEFSRTFEGRIRELNNL